MPLKLNSTGGGSVTLDVPNTGSTFTATIPAITGTMLTADTSNNVSVSGTVVMGSYFAMRNKIINGAMEIDQRNAGASLTPASGAYTLDRWAVEMSAASKFSVQRNAGSVTPPAGLPYYLGITSLSAYTVGASEYFVLGQAIEGFNSADFAWGTASAKTVTLSFWVYSSLTGTFGGTLLNTGAARNYVFSYSISSANTWEYKTVTITGDTSGTWATNNTAGVYVRFCIGAGSSVTGAAGSWSATVNRSVTGQTSIVGTNGATFYLTGVQLELGTAATPFERRLYPQELAMCQRYFQTYAALQTSSGFFLSYFGGSSAISPLAWLPITMRTTPTLSFSTTALQYYSYAGAWTNTTLQGSGISDQIIYLYCASDGDGRGKLIRTGSSGTGPIPVVSVSAEL